MKNKVHNKAVARRFAQCAMAGLLLAATGCAGVASWERERLVDPTMRFADKIDHQLVYEAREGSAGGSGSGGGGCACKR